MQMLLSSTHLGSYAVQSNSLRNYYLLICIPIYQQANIIYGNTGCRVFERGVQNWKDFCLKINKEMIEF